MKKIINTLSFLAIVFGVVASILCFMPGRGIFYSMICGLIGFFVTTIYVGLNTRHQVNINKINPGIYGLILNSIPLVYVLINIALIYFKAN